MTGRRRPLEHLLPWLGMAAAAVGWGASHQVASNAVFDDCRVGDPAFVLLVCLGGLAVAALGGYFSFDVWRRDESEGRRFIGLVGALLAALAAFAILLQAASSLILPPCAA
ncbi:MAG TPA: hypothetical protein VF547_01370 [Allosphingosinicella sp.]